MAKVAKIIAIVISLLLTIFLVVLLLTLLTPEDPVEESSVLWVGPRHSRGFDMTDFKEVTSRPWCVPPQYPARHGNWDGIDSQIIGGTIYVCESDVCRSYRPGPGAQWTDKPTMITPRRYAASTTVFMNIRGYTVWIVSGGEVSGNKLKSTEVWSGDKWEVKEEMESPVAVSRHCLVSAIPASGLMGIMQIGGSTGDSYATDKCYILGGQQVKSMSTPRQGHSCSATNSGHVIVAGGQDNRSKRLDTVEIYDIKNNTWSSNIRKLPGKDYFGKLISLGTSQLLYVGGEILGGVYSTNITDPMPKNLLWQKVADIQTTDQNRISHIIKCKI